MQVKRRYVYSGPDLKALRNETDPNLQLVGSGLGLQYDSVFDDEVVEIAVVDKVMLQFGYMPDDKSDPLEPPAAVGLQSPDGSIWQLSVDDLGALIITKQKLL